MYEWDASSLVFWHGFGSGGDAILFTRGIGTIGDNTFCVGKFNMRLYLNSRTMSLVSTAIVIVGLIAGTSAGQILVFNVPSKGGNITFEEYLPGKLDDQHQSDC